MDNYTGAGLRYASNGSLIPAGKASDERKSRQGHWL
jgi:hypothetical protein